MEKPASSGFREVEHTADWALRVWAPDLNGLFVQAAAGMNSLMGIVLKDAPMVTHHVALSARDDESLLVSFLSELLYTAEMQGVAFDQVTVNCDRHALQAQLAGRPIAQQERLIKAVTYHGLSIQRRDGLLMVTIVLDV